MKHQITAVSVAVLLSLAVPALAAPQQLTLDRKASHVDFKLQATGHVVQGSFRLIEGQLNFDTATGAMSGEIRVDAKSANTGRAARDRDMHEIVLESAKYPQFVFKAQKLEGRLARSGESQVKLHGVLSIHGSEHPFVIPATVAITGSNVKARANFSIPFVAWGMHDPSFLFVRVSKTVAVTVIASGTLAGAADSASSR